MLSNARALTVLVVAINATLWLYAAGALTTLLFRVVLKLASCADPETCHTPCRTHSRRGWREQSLQSTRLGR
jgi:hypothetical protein